MGSTFFGLGPNYRPILFDQIFSLVYAGKNFSFTEVYNMPVSYRRYFIDKVTKVIEDQNKQIDKINNQNTSKLPTKFKK